MPGLSGLGGLGRRGLQAVREVTTTDARSALRSGSITSIAGHLKLDGYQESSDGIGASPIESMTRTGMLGTAAMAES